MKFVTFKIADISTAYLTQSDLDLLEDAPNHLAEIDNGHGSIFWVPSDHDLLTEFVTLAIAHGLSEQFVNIFKALHKAKIPYVRFDCDGGDVTGLDTVSHD